MLSCDCEGQGTKVRPGRKTRIKVPRRQLVCVCVCPKVHKCFIRPIKCGQKPRWWSWREWFHRERENRIITSKIFTHLRKKLKVMGFTKDFQFQKDLYWILQIQNKFKLSILMWKAEFPHFHIKVSSRTILFTSLIGSLLDLVFFKQQQDLSVAEVTRKPCTTSEKKTTRRLRKKWVHKPTRSDPSSPKWKIFYTNAHAWPHNWRARSNSMSRRSTRSTTKGVVKELEQGTSQSTDKGNFSRNEYSTQHSIDFKKWKRNQWRVCW